MVTDVSPKWSNGDWNLCVTCLHTWFHFPWFEKRILSMLEFTSYILFIISFCTLDLQTDSTTPCVPQIPSRSLPLYHFPTKAYLGMCPLIGTLSKLKCFPFRVKSSFLLPKPLTFAIPKDNLTVYPQALKILDINTPFLCLSVISGHLYKSVYNKVSHSVVQLQFPKQQHLTMNTAGT